MKSIRFLSFLAICALLVACETAPEVDKARESEPAATEGEQPLKALPRFPPGDAVKYTVDARRSDVRIVVYKGGPLKKYGHNHVLRAEDVEGEVYVAGNFHMSAFRLAVPVRSLDVDPADARKDEGTEFMTPPSAQAIESTRTNMLGSEILNAEYHPTITLSSVSLTGPEWGPEVTVRVGLRGVERDITFPMAVERQDKELRATGTFILKTSDFGMTPFSALGGGLQVQDVVKVRFRIVAVR